MRSLIHVLSIPFVLVTAALLNGSIASSNTVDLDSIRRMFHVTDDLTILARLVNGIALSQGLTDGSVQVSSIVREFFHLGPSITFDTLLNDDISGLETDMGTIVKAVKEECGGQGSCLDARSIAEGLKVLEKIGKEVGEMERVMANTSSLGMTIALVSSLGRIQDAEKIVRMFSDVASSVWTDDSRRLRNFTDQIEILKNDFSLAFSSAKTQQKDIIEDISVMLRIENVLKTASIDQKAVDKMRNVLEEMNRKLGVLMSVLSRKAVGVINGKLHSLSQLIDSQINRVTEKTETSGLFNGFDDLTGYLGDLDTEFVTVTVGNRKSVESLLSLLDPVVKLSEQLKPLQKSWGALRLDQTTAGAELIQKDLDAAAKEVDGSFANAIVSIPSIQSCFGNVALGEKLDFDSLKNIQKVMNNFDQLVTAYRSGLGANQDPFKSMNTILTYRELVKNGSNADQFALRNQGGISQEMSSAQLVFDSILQTTFLSFIENSRVEDIATIKAEWLNRSGIGKALKCLKGNVALTSYEFSIASLTALQKLNSNKASWEPVLTTSSSLKWPLEDWKKIKTSSSRNVGSAGKQLKNARNLSMELSSGVKVIRDLAEVYKKRRAIKKLVDEQDSIDKEVNGLTDPKQKREVENVWTTETKTELKSLVEKVGQLAQTIDESPGKITDFASVFEKFEKFDFPSIDTRKLKSTLSFLKKPPGIQDTLDVIGDLDLKFVLAKKRLQSASGTLQPLMTFFDGFLNITKRANPTTSAGTPKLSTDTSTESEDPIASPFHESTTDSEPSGLWVAVSIFLIIILVVSVIGNLAIAYDNRSKKKELEKKNKQLKKMKQEEKLAKEKEKERERIEKEKAAAAEALKEKESEMGSRKMSTESDQASLPTLSPGNDGLTTGTSANNRV